MDVIIKFPKTGRGNTGIMVVVDRLSKMTHFLPIQNGTGVEEVVRLFVDRIYCLHGLPKSFVSDRNSKFIASFWRSVFDILETKLDMSFTRHSETDGQTERVNRILEEYLRGVVKYNQKNWDLFLGLVEFCYNSAIHTFTKKSPFQVVYGWQLFTPLMIGLDVPADVRIDIPAVEEFLTN
jgi:hypothetical protein